MSDLEGMHKNPDGDNRHEERPREGERHPLQFLGSNQVPEGDQGSQESEETLRQELAGLDEKHDDAHERLVSDMSKLGVDAKTVDQWQQSDTSRMSEAEKGVFQRYQLLDDAGYILGQADSNIARRELSDARDALQKADGLLIKEEQLYQDSLKKGDT